MDHENPPSKLTFKHYDTTISVEINHSDITIDDFFNMCKSIGHAAGFPFVEEYFKEE